MGFLVVCLTHYFRARRTFANSAKDSQFFLIGGLLWLVSLSIILWFLPSWKAVGYVCLGWFFIAMIAVMLHNLMHGGQLSPASIAYVPVMLRFWRCYARGGKTLQVGRSSELEIGLTEHSYDAKLEAMQNGLDLEERLKGFSDSGGQFDFPSLDEKAMIAGGGVDATSSLTLRVRGPAFCIDPATQRIPIADLVRKPARTLLIPKEEGDQKIRIELAQVTLLREKIQGFRRVR